MGFFKKLFGHGEPSGESSLQIKKDLKGEEMYVTLIGRMNAVTAPELSKVVENELGGVKRLVLDLTDLEYTSSAGLRVIMAAFEVMNRQGNMVLLNPCEAVTDVLDETGMVDFLEIIRDR